jgi:hypothetical protein
MNNDEELWRRIVEIARLSPSTHNTQGWRIVILSCHEAGLMYDNERTLPAEDVNGDLNVINMGIFVRAMEIAASSIGYRLDYAFNLKFYDPPCRYTPVAGLTLKPTLDSKDLLQNNSDAKHAKADL